MSMRHHDVFRHREFTTFLHSRLCPRPIPLPPTQSQPPPSITLPPLPALPLLSTSPPTLPPLPPPPPPPPQPTQQQQQQQDPLLLSSPFTLQHPRPSSTAVAVPAFLKTTTPSTRKRPRDSDPDHPPHHHHHSNNKTRRMRHHLSPFTPVTSPTAVAAERHHQLQPRARSTEPAPHPVLHTARDAVQSLPLADLPSLGTRSSSETDDVEESQLTPCFECELCNTRFFRKHHLERHIQNIHEGQRPWTCEVCGFAFHQKPNLERHIMTVHESQRPFRCSVCEMSFGRKGVLKKHIQMVHEHSRKFECDTCKVSFGLKSDLKRHVQSVHQKQRPFVCEVCSASFGRKSDLKRHTLSLHPGVELPSKKTTAPSSGPDTS